MSKSRHADPSLLIRSFGVTFSSGHIIPPHAEDWHQLIYAIQGVMTVRTEDSAWVVTPHRAVWIPARIQYRVEMSGIVAMRTIYLPACRPARFKGMPRTCSVVSISPLLRELIVRTVEWSVLDSRVPEQRRVAAVILDELKAIKVAPLQLPMPTDKRAVCFVAQANQISLSLGRLTRNCGASRRTLERIFREETAMTLGQWLRRYRLLHGLRRLASGECVNSVSLELGYNSPSAFIAMFRRELGETPGRYFSS